jgi:uncharacterized protein YndB with AHSA1/START domain
MNNLGGLIVTTPTDREIVMTRVFHAPRQLVFDAWTKPELVRRWLLGPPGWTMPVCEIDLRVGGAYRFVWLGEDGTTMGMGGVYREIVIPERIVTRSCSTRIGPAARRWERCVSPSRTEKPRSRTRCSTPRAKLAMVRCARAWRRVSRQATPGSMICCRRWHDAPSEREDR